jgi:hypothetical protein
MIANCGTVGALKLLVGTIGCACGCCCPTIESLMKKKKKQIFDLLHKLAAVDGGCPHSGTDVS